MCVWDMENIEEGKEHLKGPNGQPSEISLCKPEGHLSCGAGEPSMCGLGQPSLSYREGQHSLSGARELALFVAGEPQLGCKDGESSLCGAEHCTGTDHHSSSAPDEHTLCVAGEHSLCKTGEHTLCVAGEHSSCKTGEHSSCTTEGLPLHETEAHRSCLPEEHTPCVAGEPSLCTTGEVPTYGSCVVGEHTLCVAGEHSLSTTGEVRTDEDGGQQSRSDEPLCRRLAFLTFSIVALNIGMFFVTMYVNDCPNTSPSCFLPFLHRLSFQPLHENTLIGPSSQTLERLGALDANKVQHAHQGWRLVTCIWLHAGVVHVLVNMISLLFIGIRLEQESGAVKVGMIFLLSGLGGSLLSVLFLQNVSVGASGALFGLVGAMLSELLTNWTIYTNKCAVMTVLIFVVAANLAMGIFPFVDNFAHIGGLIVGFLSGFVLLIKPQYGYVKPSSLTSGNRMQARIKAKHKGYQYVLWVTALILLIAGIAGVAVLVFQGVNGNKKCSWCHYLSCVPTSKWDCHNVIACNKSQVNNEWQITCASNHKTTLAPLNQSDVMLEELCVQLCS